MFYYFLFHIKIRMNSNDIITHNKKKRKRAKKNKSNIISSESLERILDCKAKRIYCTDKEEHEETGYFVEVVECSPNDDPFNPFIVKSTNQRVDIDDEWKNIKFLQDNMEDPHNFIKNTSLITSPLNGKVALKMPKLKSFDKLRKMSHFESNAHVYIRQLLNQLYLFHKAGLCHSDIKSDNFMYDEQSDTLLLIDYGSSIIIEECVKDECRDLSPFDINRELNINRSHMQTSGYRAPECFDSEDLEDYDDWNDELDRLEEKFKCKKDPILRRKIRNLEDEAPDCSEMLEYFDSEELESAEHSFAYHNTIYSDIYALGICLLEYMDEILSQEQCEFLTRMMSCDIKDRPTPSELSEDNTKIFMYGINSTITSNVSKDELSSLSYSNNMEENSSATSLSEFELELKDFDKLTTEQTESTIENTEEKEENDSRGIISELCGIERCDGDRSS